MAAAVSCYLIGISTNELDSGIKSFNGLEHRIENVGLFDGILWYNDSIATIPEATIEAVKTLHNVDTLILGGFDRGIEYGILYPFLNSSGISNIIFVGEAGARMRKEFDQFGVNKIKFYSSADYEEVVIKAKEITRQGMICLLSPAAASYDMFRNFEERGKFYKKSVRNLKPLTL
jgi:UDP-N-acetylmuramoylalanine--D-glutamate ligase